MVDGEGGADIECSVHGSGPYTFSGSIQALSTESDRVTLTLSNGVVNADKLTGTVTLGVATPQLSGTFVSEQAACTVTVVGQHVKPGSVYATVSCPTINNPSTAQVCTVGPITTFVLENCDGT